MADKDDKKKKKTRPSDISLLFAQLASIFANTDGTKMGAELGLQNAQNMAAGEYQKDLEKAEKKAKKGGVLGQLGRIGGTAAASLIPGVGPVTAPFVGAALGEAGGAAGQMAAGNEVDPMAAVLNAGLGGVQGYAKTALLDKPQAPAWEQNAPVVSKQIAPNAVQSPAGSVPSMGQEMRLNVPGVTDTAPVGGSAPAATQPVPEAAPTQTQRDMRPVEGGSPRTPEGRGPDSLQMDINDQGLSNALPAPGAAAPQPQGFMDKLVGSITQAILTEGLPKFDTVRSASPTPPRALSAETAAAMRNEGQEREFRQATIQNQQAQTQATVANTQLNRDKFGYEQGRDVIGDKQFDTRIGLEQQQITQSGELGRGQLAVSQQQAAEAARANQANEGLAQQGMTLREKAMQQDAANAAASRGIAAQGLSLDQQRFNLQRQQATQPEVVMVDGVPHSIARDPNGVPMPAVPLVSTQTAQDRDVIRMIASASGAGQMDPNTGIVSEGDPAMQAAMLQEFDTLVREGKDRNTALTTVLGKRGSGSGASSSPVPGIQNPRIVVGTDGKIQMPAR